MLKQLLTVAAAAVIGLSAQAKMVEDYRIDYTTRDWGFYVMGYIPEKCDDGILITQTRASWEFVDGVATATPNEDKDGDGQPDVSWYQLFVADGIPTSIGLDYTVTIYGKSDVDANSDMNMQWGWGDGQQMKQSVPFTTEWAEIPVTYKEVGGASCALVLQPGTQETKFWIKWISVSHNESESVEEWINIAVNGDAEGEQGEGTSAVAKSNLNSDPEAIGPAEVVAEGDGNVFVVHAGAKVENPWDNQFWIVSPQAFAKNESFKVSFRYKAAAPAKVTTQIHTEPGSYKHWNALGDMSFTTEWQEMSKTLTVEEAADGMKSIAFNLNEIDEANDYYFDDIKIEILKLDEGWFVAGDFNDWTFGEAVELAYNDDDEVYVGTVGTEDTPASQVMISSRRGSDNAFRSNAIKLKAEIIDGEAIEYAVGYSKIDLPEAGVWTITIDEEYEQIIFESDGSGIENVAVDNAPAVYYNLQGVKVLNPTAGNIYIVKRGNKVAKQVIR